MNKEKMLKIGGALAAGLLISGAGFAGGMLSQTPVIESLQEQNRALSNIEVPAPVVVEKEVIVEKEVPVNVTVEKLVPVDNGKLDIVEEYLTDIGMFDEESDVIPEIEAIYTARQLALDYLDDELADELEDYDLVEDEDEVNVIKVYSNSGDIEILESDFNDDEYEFKIRVKVEDEDENEKFKVWAVVKVEDNEAKIVSLEKIEE